jgi:hypothetical protein
MRSFTRLLAIGALIAATIGVAPAGAAKPEPPNGSDGNYRRRDGDVCAGRYLTVTVASIEVAPDTAELNDFNLHVARIGKVRPNVIAYEPTQQQEQWGLRVLEWI